MPQGQGLIKAGDTLLFDVELLGFAEKAKERWEMSVAELMAESIKIKVEKRQTLVLVFLFHPLLGVEGCRRECSKAFRRRGRGSVCIGYTIP